MLYMPETYGVNTTYIVSYSRKWDGEGFWLLGVSSMGVGAVPEHSGVTKFVKLENLRRL